MIALLEGRIAEKTNDTAIISCAGVGYGVWVTAEDWARLNVGVAAKVYVYEHIREQSHDLFGFIELHTKKLFELLLTVNGVGPKMALSILSIGKADSVRKAIAAGDVNFLKSANGVGKRVAERLVVDLKDKVGFESSDDSLDFINYPSINQNDEALDALISLGYSTLDAQKALQGIDSNLSAERRIKLALQGGVSK